jgi:hypothetical protein
MQRTRPVTARVGIQVLAGGVLACAGGTPAPGGPPTPLDTRTPAEIRTYVNDLKFDEKEFSGDKRRLPVGCPNACREGPLVAIQPEENTHRNRLSDLAGSPGRIIARLINLDRTQGYPPLNLAAGDTVYWAVDSVRSLERENIVGRSLWISAAGLQQGRKPLRQRLKIKEHPKYSYKQALARWVEDTIYAKGETPGGGERDILQYIALATWNNCKSSSCCGP